MSSIMLFIWWLEQSPKLSAIDSSKSCTVEHDRFCRSLPDSVPEYTVPVPCISSILSYGVRISGERREASGAD